MPLVKFQSCLSCRYYGNLNYCMLGKFYMTDTKPCFMKFFNKAKAKGVK